MVKDASATDPLKAHPTVEKLVDKASGLADSMTLKGYIGPSSSEERFAIYPSFDDLTLSFELERADVVAVDDAPEGLLPNGGKKDAVITRRDTRTAEEHVQMRRGRLTITIARRSMRGDGCEECSPPEPTCSSKCRPTCRSVCASPCQSTCDDNRMMVRRRRF